MGVKSLYSRLWGLFFLSILLLIPCGSCTGNADRESDDNHYNEYATVIQEEHKYALLVGVSNFEYDFISEIKYGARDAEKMKFVLVQVFGYKKKNVIIMTNEDATKKNIIEGLKDIKNKANSDKEQILFFYSGHGARINHKDYILPYDTEKPALTDENYSSLISIDDINEEWKEFGGKKIILLDACRSDVVKDKTILPPSSDKLEYGIEIDEENIADDNTIIINSTQEGEPAYESTNPDIRNSIFTHSIVSAVRNKKTDKDGDGELSLEEVLEQANETMGKICEKENAPITQKAEIKTKKNDNISTPIGKTPMHYVPDDVDPYIEDVDFNEIRNTTEFTTLGIVEKTVFNNIVEIFEKAEKHYKNENYEKALKTYMEIKEKIEETTFYQFSDNEAHETFVKLHNEAKKYETRLNQYFDTKYVNELIMSGFDQARIIQAISDFLFISYYETETKFTDNPEMLFQALEFYLTSIAVMRELLEKDIKRNGKKLSLPEEAKQTIKDNIEELKGYVSEVEKQLYILYKVNKVDKAKFESIIRQDINLTQDYKTEILDDLNISTDKLKDIYDMNEVVLKKAYIETNYNNGDLKILISSNKNDEKLASYYKKAYAYFVIGENGDAEKYRKKILKSKSGFHDFINPSKQTQPEETTQTNDVHPDLESVSYRDMVYVDGGTFTQITDETDDSGGFRHTISSFEIGKYEVTYELWYTVYQWAIDNGYKFANEGQEGHNGTDGAKPKSSSKHEPVTVVNWRDTIVWCNAYSEMCNKSPVYLNSRGKVIKDSRDSNRDECDSAEPDWDADGYRLPTEGEWQFAASDRGDTPYDYASGASDDYGNSSATKKVAWYDDNACDGVGSDHRDYGTHDVGTKRANDLGLYDMSGNVYEWCWDWYDDLPTSSATDYRNSTAGSSRVLRGGCWYYFAQRVRVGYRDYYGPYIELNFLGFLLARRP